MQSKIDRSSRSSRCSRSSREVEVVDVVEVVVEVVEVKNYHSRGLWEYNDRGVLLKIFLCFINDQFSFYI